MEQERRSASGQCQSTPLPFRSCHADPATSANPVSQGASCGQTVWRCIGCVENCVSWFQQLCDPDNNSNDVGHTLCVWRIGTNVLPPNLSGFPSNDTKQISCETHSRSLPKAIMASACALENTGSSVPLWNESQPLMITL